MKNTKSSYLTILFNLERIRPAVFLFADLLSAIGNPSAWYICQPPALSQARFFLVESIYAPRGTEPHSHAHVEQRGWLFSFSMISLREMRSRF